MKVTARWAWRSSTVIARRPAAATRLAVFAKHIVATSAAPPAGGSLTGFGPARRQADRRRPRSWRLARCSTTVDRARPCSTPRRSPPSSTTSPACAASWPSRRDDEPHNSPSRSMPYLSAYELPDLIAVAVGEQARGKRLEIWFQDESRIGQKGALTRPSGAPARPLRCRRSIGAADAGRGAAVARDSPRTSATPPPISSPPFARQPRRLPPWSCRRSTPRP